MNQSPFRFRPQTIDDVVFRHVVTENEYKVPSSLGPDDLVIDIGAHIGSFSYLCWSAGSRCIEAFEADPENASLARENLALPGIAVVEKAVWRSDIAVDVLHHSGYVAMRSDGPDPVSVNTGGGCILSGNGLPVDVVSLDEVIGDREVSLLKIDCEGSEYPILLTSSRLSQVRRIVGEYHVTDINNSLFSFEGKKLLSPGILLDHLVSENFRVEIIPHTDPRFSLQVGLFFADNLDFIDQ